MPSPIDSTGKNNLSLRIRQGFQFCLKLYGILDLRMSRQNDEHQQQKRTYFSHSLFVFLIITVGKAIRFIKLFHSLRTNGFPLLRQ